jgi:hypothetical protein
MKEFEVDIETLKGENLEGGCLYVLKKAIFERSLDLHLPTPLASPKLKAQQEALKFEQALLTLDRRFRRAVHLLVANLEQKLG